MVFRMFDCKKERLIKLLDSGIIITGTDTNVGKTFFATFCLKITQGTYWKPIQSGLPCDRSKVQEETALDNSHFIEEVYNFTQPLSPHEAASYDNKKIILNRLKMPTKILCPPLIIEGAGGVLVPLNKKTLMIDLFSHFNLPAVVIARSTLGTINHTLMTLECLRRRKIPILGVVMVGPFLPENEKAISYYGKTHILARSK